MKTSYHLSIDHQQEDIFLSPTTIYLSNHQYISITYHLKLLSVSSISRFSRHLEHLEHPRKPPASSPKHSPSCCPAAVRAAGTAKVRTEGSAAAWRGAGHGALHGMGVIWGWSLNFWFVIVFFQPNHLWFADREWICWGGDLGFFRKNYPRTIWLVMEMNILGCVDGKRIENDPVGLNLIGNQKSR